MLSRAYHLDEPQSLFYDADCCVEAEYSRVRGVALIRKKYLPAILASPEDAAVWQTGMGMGSVFVLPRTSGAFDSGLHAKLKGYGRRISTKGVREMTLSFADPNYKSNWPFYNYLYRRTDMVPAFRTESLVHICDSAADLDTKEVVADDVEAVMEWGVECSLRSMDLPIHVPAASLATVFSCANELVSVVVGGVTIAASCLKVIARFRVGDFGAPMMEGDTAFFDLRLQGLNVLVFADSAYLNVDDGSGAVDYTGSIQRHIIKIKGDSRILFVGGVTAKEIIEIYAFA